jgi:hypothetical protein
MTTLLIERFQIHFLQVKEKRQRRRHPMGPLLEIVAGQLDIPTDAWEELHTIGIDLADLVRLIADLEHRKV